MRKTSLCAGVLCSLLLSLPSGADEGVRLRPPAVPLVAHDPYFSVWSQADRLTDCQTTHWTGKPQPLNSVLRIDGQVFRVMGIAPADAPALPQTEVRVFPTRTVYSFGSAKISLVLTFLTPALPSDLDVLSRPVTYVTWEVASADGKPHAVQIDFGCSGLLAVDTPQQETVWDRPQVDGLLVARVGSKTQRVLARRGDDLRIDWGYAYLAAPADPRTQIVEDGVVRFDLGQVAEQTAACHAMLAYDDLYAIRYFDERLRPYWRRSGWGAADLLRAAAKDYASLVKRCSAFDEALMVDLARAGGEKYAALCALAYRQTFAGNKLAADSKGMPLLFPKENHSNGCISTVDVLFPQAPFFLVFSPALTQAMLVPVLDYAASPKWPYPYAPHDLGTYPFAIGQVYGMGGGDGGRMPLEESGNMLIMLAALAKAEGHADFAKRYWPQLTKWADYCVAEGLDPQNQLCSADMFGHMPRSSNLALKAIIGIGGYAQLCEMLGESDRARKYMGVARDYAAKWQALSKGDGHTLLAYGKPGTWAMKHNLIWDRALGTKLFPDEVGDAEIAWYLKAQNKYGLPVDNRTDTSLIDWNVWSIAPARNPADFQALFEPVFRYVQETPSRVPLSDWFVTTTGKMRGFQARSVVGGVFVKLLADAQTWKRWAGLAQKVPGEWAPFKATVFGPPKELVPTARKEPVVWRYTLEKPADDWMKPAFDDTAWKAGPAGFGTAGTPGAVVRTDWKSKDIWLRRAYTLASTKLDSPRLLAHYDEDATVYLNGVLAAELPGWTTAYEQFPVQAEALAALRAGKNVMAVHCQQTTGGQYIDVGLAVSGDSRVPDARVPDVKPLFDFPVRDTSVCLGPDGTYYMTGTTGHPTWWKTNDGIRVWKSKDLVAWAPLGFVWSFAKDATWQKLQDEKRAIWAPELHYFKGTFWIAYCVNTGGTGILRSKTGKADGPYEDMKPDGPLTGGIDASLFADDDGKIYFVWQNGQVARLKDDLTGLAEAPRLLKPANAAHVGFEGAFLTKIGGRYHLIGAEFNERQGQKEYDCMAASSDSVYGPYGNRYLAVPCGGHNVLFEDAEGKWWSTFFGNDPLAPFRERPALLRIHINADGEIQFGE